MGMQKRPSSGETKIEKVSRWTKEESKERYDTDGHKEK